MHLSFRLSRKDLAALQEVASRRVTEVTRANYKLFFFTVIIWIPLGVALATYFALYRKYPEAAHDLTIVAAALALGIALFICHLYYKQHLTRRGYLSDDGWFLAEQTVDADTDGLGIQTARGHTSFRWTAFMHRAEDHANLYLFVDNAQAVIIPKSAFGSTDDASRFRSLAGFR